MLRNEMKEGIARAQTQLTELLNNALARMQTESDRRAYTMLERLVPKFREASEQVSQNIVPAARASAMQTVLSLIDELVSLAGANSEHVRYILNCVLSADRSASALQGAKMNEGRMYVRVSLVHASCRSYQIRDYSSSAFMHASPPTLQTSSGRM